MSYLSLPRLAFSGTFQADTSTVNNDVRHYDNERFEPQFQKPQDGKEWNGWWNPSGTGAFRLIDVRVVQALSELDAGDGDDAVGLYLNAQVERSAAKLVDLDPQFQMGSMIFGLRIALTDGKTEYMRGTFRPTAFRDIYFGRSPAPASAGASAKFTSVLTHVHWNETCEKAVEFIEKSPVLSKLKQSSRHNDDTLAINLMTYAFVGNAPFLGRVSGSIGTWKTGQPKSFIAGRRFAAVGGNGMATPEGIGFFDAEVCDYVSLDLGNALPLSARIGEMNSVGELAAVVLKTPDSESTSDQGQKTVSPGFAQGAEIDASDMVELGKIDYLTLCWLSKTAGLVDFKIPGAAKDIIANHPLALVSPVCGKPDTFQVMIREAVAGLFIRAEDFEARIDAQSSGWVKAERELYAMQWGKPLANAPVTMVLQPKQSGGGGGGGINQPTAPIPDINFPAESVRWGPTSKTNSSGVVPTTFHASNPGNPRGYVDGQIFQVNYGINRQGVSPMHPFDLFVLHVREAFDVPDWPDWFRDIEPFMKQYGNLYPVMSHDLFSLSDPKVAEQHAHLLSFAFERPLDDPNHMPATRDLSKGKRKTILKWLSRFMPEHEMAPAKPEVVARGGEIPDPPPVGVLQPLSDETIDRALATLGEGNDGKTQAMRDFLTAQRSA